MAAYDAVEAAYSALMYDRRYVKSGGAGTSLAVENSNVMITVKNVLKPQISGSRSAETERLFPCRIIRSEKVANIKSALIGEKRPIAISELFRLYLFLSLNPTPMEPGTMAQAMSVYSAILKYRGFTGRKSDRMPPIATRMKNGANERDADITNSLLVLALQTLYLLLEPPTLRMRRIFAFVGGVGQLRRNGSLSPKALSMNGIPIASSLTEKHCG